MRCSEAGNAFTVIAGFTMLRHRLSKYASSKGSASGDAFVLAPRYYALSVMPPSGKPISFHTSGWCIGGCVHHPAPYIADAWPDAFPRGHKGEGWRHRLPPGASALYEAERIPRRMRHRRSSVPPEAVCIGPDHHNKGQTAGRRCRGHPHNTPANQIHSHLLSQISRFRYFDHCLSFCGVLSKAHRFSRGAQGCGNCPNPQIADAALAHSLSRSNPFDAPGQPSMPASDRIHFDVSSAFPSRKKPPYAFRRLVQIFRPITGGEAKAGQSPTQRCRSPGSAEPTHPAHNPPAPSLSANR